MYKYYARDILYAFNVAASPCHCASFLQLFQKFVQYPESPTIIQKFLNTCFGSTAIENI